MYHVDQFAVRIFSDLPNHERPESVHDFDVVVEFFVNCVIIIDSESFRNQFNVVEDSKSDLIVNFVEGIFVVFEAYRRYLQNEVLVGSAYLIVRLELLKDINI